MKIIAFHENNDFSGSPAVLRTVLEGLLKNGHEVILVTSPGGVLDQLRKYPGITFKYVKYRFSKITAITLLQTLRAQWRALCIGLHHGRDRVFYANTVISFGGAMAARLTGRPVMYHYHENAYKKNIYYRIGARWMQRLADSIVCVSKYQRYFLKRRRDVLVVPNSVPTSFAEAARPDIDAAFERRNVLLVASLKDYKGIPEFIELASRMPEFYFTMVLNENREAIDRYLADLPRPIPANLHVYDHTHDVVDFYNNASVVLNLTNPDLCIESFGLTVIEAFTCGLPVIVPDEGGIAELVENDREGYKTDVRKPDLVEKHIRAMLTDKKLYRRLAKGALEGAERFSAAEQTRQIEALLQSFCK